MRTSLLIVITAAALAFAGSATAATSVERTAFATSYTNPCTGETFSVSGSVHHRVSLTVNATGAWQLSEQYTFQGVSGTTATGVKYVIPGTNVIKEHVDVDGAPAIFRFDGTQRFIRQGSDASYPGGDDLLLRVHSVFAIDADGNVTQDEFTVTIECG